MGEKKDRDKSVPAVCEGNCSFEAPSTATPVPPFGQVPLAYPIYLFSSRLQDPPLPALPLPLSFYEPYG
jgi:hypothetical protein